MEEYLSLAFLTASSVQRMGSPDLEFAVLLACLIPTDRHVLPLCLLSPINKIEGNVVTLNKEGEILAPLK